MRAATVACGAILVYDISRWGRFQDIDEAAHYEFICKDAGIPIYYCTEQFRNDGTPQSTIMKALKRSMAAEFSRELGEKVREGHQRLAALGFRQAARAPFGMVRTLISANGSRRKLMDGERKSISTDRVILVPGAEKEVRCIKKMFAMAAKKKMTPGQIAEFLNRNPLGWGDYRRTWTSQSVWRVLRNPEYCGSNVWGRTTGRLGSPTRCTDRSDWVIKPHAFPGVVTQAIFDRAQKLIESRKNYPGIPQEVLIRNLKALLARHGRLSSKIILRSRLYSPRTYASHLGALAKAYAMVGYTPEPRIAKSLRNALQMNDLHSQLIQKLRAGFPNQVRVRRQRARAVIELNSSKISVYLCRQFLTKAGRKRWMFRIREKERHNLAFICPTSAGFGKILASYVLPPVGNAIRRFKVIQVDDPYGC